jgi:predicted secreted protein
MSNVILGKNIILYLTNGLGSNVRIGAARTVKFSGTREMKETSDSASGSFKTFIAGMVDQTLSISGLMNFSNGSQYDYSDLYSKLVAAGTNLISFQFKEDNGTYVYTYSGQAIVSSFVRTKQYNDAGAYDVEMQVCGPVTVTSTGTSIPYYWLTSPTALTPSAVVSLIQAGSATGVSAPSYSTISINFGVPAGAYLYFAIPATSPNRLSYYVSVGDNGPIGSPGNLFNYVTLPITIGSGSPINYKVYSSNISKANNSPMDLRTFYPTSGGIVGYGNVYFDTYTCSGSEGTSVIISSGIGIQLNKIISIARTGTMATNILAYPSIVTGDDAAWDPSSGTVYFANPVVAGEVLTITYLGL